MNTREADVCVVGGGPAGMMAAIAAAERGKKVIIVEKNISPGIKLSITGGGRCNIANNEPDVRKLLANYGDAGKFLFSAFSQFGIAETIAFFESRNFPLVTQERNRMFPATQKSTDVVSFFLRELKKAKIDVLNNSTVSTIKRKAGVYVVTTKAGATVRAASVIISTGGYSRPETGSTGDGYKIARTLGHTTFEPNPDIVPLRTHQKDEWIYALSGVSLSHMRITFSQDGAKKITKLGKILFTHFGISGPLILNSARQVGELLKNGNVDAVIDMYPDTQFDTLEKRVLSVFNQHKNKSFRNVFPLIVPKGMAKSLITLVQINIEKKIHSVTQDERKALIHLLKALPLTITGRMGMDRAVVSDGGIPLEEVDTRTFESKKSPGLFLVGDMLHISRPSGGFSLQLCWTSGHVAGNAA